MATTDATRAHDREPSREIRMGAAQHTATAVRTAFGWLRDLEGELDLIAVAYHDSEPELAKLARTVGSRLFGLRLELREIEDHAAGVSDRASREGP